jgi:hypothetical protein
MANNNDNNYQRKLFTKYLERWIPYEDMLEFHDMYIKEVIII